MISAHMTHLTHKAVRNIALGRVAWITRILFCLVITAVLASCDLFRAVASPPRDTPAGTPVNDQGAGHVTLSPDQITTLAIPAASLTIGSANIIYWSPFNGDMAIAGDEAVRLIALGQTVVQVQALVSAPVQSISAAEPILFTGAQAAARLAWADSANQVVSFVPNTGIAPTGLVQEDAPVTGLALAPQGTQLAVATSDGKLTLLEGLDQPTAQIQENLPLPGWLSNLSYSPDGKWIGGTDLPNFIVYILDAQTGNVVRTLEWIDSPTPNLYGVFFSPDWSQVAWVAQTAVQITNVTDGSKGPLLSHEDHVGSLAWSPDGQRLATASSTSTGSGPIPVIQVWDSTSGVLLKTLPLATAIRSLAFSPDGNQMASIDGNQNLQVWNLEP